MVGYLFGPLLAVMLNAAGAGACSESVSMLLSPHADRMVGLERDQSIELISQALASGMLAGVMRAPVGSALLVSFMGSGEGTRTIQPGVLSLLLLTNFIAVYVNPLSGLGQVYEDHTEESRSATPATTNSEHGAGATTIADASATTGSSALKPASSPPPEPLKKAASTIQSLVKRLSSDSLSKEGAAEAGPADEGKSTQATPNVSASTDHAQ
jgi:hypothetical protein